LKRYISSSMPHAAQFTVIQHSSVWIVN